MLPCRPVLEVHALPMQRLLLFIDHRTILAWGAEGEVWHTAKLSDEGVNVGSIEGRLLRGSGWSLMTDRETAFTLNLENGLLVGA
jgi:hypothetical protein